MGWHYRDVHRHGDGNHRDRDRDIYRTTRDSWNWRKHRRHGMVHHGHWRMAHNQQRDRMERHHDRYLVCDWKRVWLVNCHCKRYGSHWSAAYNRRWRNDRRHWMGDGRDWGVGHHDISDRVGWHYRDVHRHGDGNHRDRDRDIYRTTRDSWNWRKHRRHGMVHHGHWRMVHNQQRDRMERHRNRQRHRYRGERNDRHQRRRHRYGGERNGRRLAAGPLPNDAPP